MSKLRGPWKRSDVVAYMTMRWNYTEENPDVADTIQEKMAWVLKGLEEHGLVTPPHRAIIIGNPDIKTSEDMATKPALIVKDVQVWDDERESGAV